MRRVLAGAIVLVLVGFSPQRCSTAMRAPSPRCSVRQAGATPPTPEHTARAVGRGMLAEVALPPSAEPYTGVLPKVLAAPSTWPGVEPRHLVDVHREWTVATPASSLLHFEFLAPGRGFVRPNGYGSFSLRGGETATYIDAAFGPLPVNVALAQLNVAWTARGDGHALIRIDAFVAWTPPKAATEYVPAEDRAAVVMALAPSSPAKAFRTVVVTDPAEVAALAAGVDQMRLAPLSLPSGCGLNPVYVPDIDGYAPATTLHEVAFSATAASAPNFIVVTPMCGNTIAVRAHGKAQLPLHVEPDDAFSRAVQGILTSRR